MPDLEDGNDEVLVPHLVQDAVVPLSDPKQIRTRELLAARRLEESDVPYDVDIIDLGKASPEIRARVEREGLRWNG